MLVALVRLCECIPMSYSPIRVHARVRWQASRSRAYPLVSCGAGVDGEGGPASAQQPNKRRGLVPRCLEYLFNQIARETRRTNGYLKYSSGTSAPFVNLFSCGCCLLRRLFVPPHLLVRHPPPDSTVAAPSLRSSTRGCTTCWTRAEARRWLRGCRCARTSGRACMSKAWKSKPSTRPTRLLRSSTRSPRGCSASLLTPEAVDC